MTWDKQQRHFAKALVDPLREVPCFVAKSADQPSRKRFNVYRNNIMVSLCEAINDNYPVVAQLVGEEFATAMARVYVGDNLPGSPVMLEYGEGYAEFIESFEPARGLPFLADVARLEWAWLQAFHSADETPITLDALAQIDEDKLGNLSFQFCQSVRLLRSEHAFVSIWSAHQSAEIEQGLGKLSHAGEYALVNRPFENVEIRLLAPATYAFFSTLASGLPLGMAIDKGNSFNDFDPAEAINALFETKLVAALKQ